MTTFAQWRSPSHRLAPDAPNDPPRKYDMRVVDQFYTYSCAVSQADRHRKAAAKSQRAAKRNFWTALATASVLGYYLVERVAQATALF